MVATSFEQLGLDAGASRRVVERAWRRYALRHHPDRGGDAESFVRGQQAYDRIIDEFEYRQYEAFWEAGSVDDEHVNPFQPADPSLVIPAGYRFAVGALAALLQFIFIWTRIMAFGGVMFILISPFHPIPRDQLWEMSLIGGIGFAGVALELLAVPGRIRKRLERVYARREEERREAASLGQVGAVDRHSTSQQYGNIAVAFVLLTGCILWMTWDVLSEPRDSNWQLFFNPLYVGYVAIAYWRMWILHPQRAARLQVWFTLSMIAGFVIIFRILAHNFPSG